MEYAVEVKNLTKVYNLYQKPIDRLKESVSITKKKYHTDFYALNDISFKVEKGQCVGVIGTNGSGKSTILKIITGVLNPTKGTVKIKGKVSALLELGAGFNPDYTGIENVYLNGRMLGFGKEEIDQKLEEILAFADIGDFVYQPVKTYSSGMFVRLAFAIAINVEPEVLIVDEALSVGDVFFQAKCYKKINEIKERGTTILLVTHDMGNVIKYCDKVVLLNKGDFVGEGPANKMVDIYKKILANQFDGMDEQFKKEVKVVAKDGEFWKDKIEANPNTVAYGGHEAEIVDYGVFDHNNSLTNLVLKGSPFTIKMKVRFNKDVASPIFAFTIKDKKGTEITGTNTLIEGYEIEPAMAGKIYTVSFLQETSLQGGEYLLSLGCTGYEENEFVIYDRLYDVTNITVISNKNTIGVYDMSSVIHVIAE